MDRKLYRLSVEQRGYWSYTRNNKNVESGGWYIMGTCYYDDSGSFDADAMEKAYFELLRRNQSFRAGLIRKGLSIRQYFHEADEFPAPERRSMESLDELKAYCASGKVHLISIFDEFLTCAEIISCGDGCGGIVLWQHHICTDGYSTGAIGYKQVNEFYACYKAGKEPAPQKKLVLFSDYVEAQLKNRKKHYLRDLVWCWKEYNRNVWNFRVPVHASMDEQRYNHIPVYLVGDRLKRLKACLPELKCSLPFAVMTALAFTVYTVSDVKRFLFTYGVHGRSTYAQKQMTGALADGLSMFMDFTHTGTVKEFTLGATDKFTQVSKHSSFSLTEIEVYFMWLMRLFGKMYPYDFSMLSVSNVTTITAEGDNALKLIFLEQPGTGDPFYVEIKNAEDGVRLDCLYIPGRTTDEEAEYYLRVFSVALDEMIAHPDMQISELVSKLKTVK